VSEYLALGDKAFREARYNDAVLSYAKAVEASPGDGVLHLVFSDALFAAGEYHFAASALRRALELDPKLVNSVVDKHGFYGDPTDLDRQITQLEKFLETHFADDDARLVLAANYLFAGRAAQASELLESSLSTSVRESSAGQLILARAHELKQSSPAKK
jgi:tetratricopeptide (TPR) repeat protein